VFDTRHRFTRYAGSETASEFGAGGRRGGYGRNQPLGMNGRFACSASAARGALDAVSPPGDPSRLARRHRAQATLIAAEALTAGGTIQAPPPEHGGNALDPKVAPGVGRIPALAAARCTRKWSCGGRVPRCRAERDVT
jgi:hypothetical protein